MRATQTISQVMIYLLNKLIFLKINFEVYSSLSNERAEWNETCRKFDQILEI